MSSRIVIKMVAWKSPSDSFLSMFEICMSSSNNWFMDYVRDCQHGEMNVLSIVLTVTRVIKY
jgi:hypothetical protein